MFIKVRFHSYFNCTTLDLRFSQLHLYDYRLHGSRAIHFRGKGVKWSLRKTSRKPEEGEINSCLSSYLRWASYCSMQRRQITWFWEWLKWETSTYQPAGRYPGDSCLCNSWEKHSLFLCKSIEILCNFKISMSSNKNKILLSNKTRLKT